MAREISKECTYKCKDCSRHNEIKGAKTKVNVRANQILVHRFSHVLSIVQLCLWKKLSPLEGL